MRVFHLKVAIHRLGTDWTFSRIEIQDFNGNPLDNGVEIRRGSELRMVEKKPLDSEGGDVSDDEDDDDDVDDDDEDDLDDEEESEDEDFDE